MTQRSSLSYQLALIYRHRTVLTNAQIKALPTTAIQVIAAPLTGYRTKVIGATFNLNNSAGGYTNIDATWAVLGLGMPDMATGWWQINPIVNDVTAPIAFLTTYLGTPNNLVADLSVPTFGIHSGYIAQGAFPGVGDVGGVVAVSMDNNGTGDLTGGNAANTLTVTVTYTTELI